MLVIRGGLQAPAPKQWQLKTPLLVYYRGDPPRDGAGSYDFCPWETEFFALTKDAGWNLPYGRFFMEWYSNKLVQHGGDVIDAIKPAIASAVSSNGSKSTVRPCTLIHCLGGLNQAWPSGKNPARMQANQSQGCDSPEW